MVPNVSTFTVSIETGDLKIIVFNCDNFMRIVQTYICVIKAM